MKRRLFLALSATGIAGLSAGVLTACGSGAAISTAPADGVASGGPSLAAVENGSKTAASPTESASESQSQGPDLSGFPTTLADAEPVQVPSILVFTPPPEYTGFRQEFGLQSYGNDEPPFHGMTIMTFKTTVSPADAMAEYESGVPILGAAAGAGPFFDIIQAGTTEVDGAQAEVFTADRPEGTDIPYLRIVAIQRDGYLTWINLHSTTAIPTTNEMYDRMQRIQWV